MISREKELDPDAFPTEEEELDAKKKEIQEYLTKLKKESIYYKQESHKMTSVINH